MNEERLKEIKEEQQILCAKLTALNTEKYELTHENELSEARASLGKFYKKSDSGMGEECIFAPKKVNADEKMISGVTLCGESVSCQMFLIGSIHLHVSNTDVVMADDFLKEYKEITKDEYDERKKRMLGYFLKD
jgi:hypothetical protein